MEKIEVSILVRQSFKERAHSPYLERPPLLPPSRRNDWLPYKQSVFILDLGKCDVIKCRHPHFLHLANGVADDG
jgi:hypothetical protein